MQTYNTLASAYSEIIYNLIYNPDFICSPRNKKIKEILGYKIVITNPYSNLFTNEIRSLPLDYLKKELILYFSGTNKLKYFEKASKFWKKIANPDGTVNSAYGHLIFKEKDTYNKTLSQWDWAYYNLFNDKDSRQAIMHFNKPEHMLDKVKDFPCTLTAQFFIRHDKLYMIVNMRSNDIIKGVSFDFPWFMLLQQLMLKELKYKYPNLTMGSYTHISASMHAYEDDWKLLEKMLKYPFCEKAIPLINENPIKHRVITKMLENNDFIYKGNDEFFKWLQE